MTQARFADHRRGLSVLHESELESIVQRFEEAWEASGQAEIDEFLPAELQLRRAALVELVHADLAHRLKRGQKVRVERYLSEYSQLTEEADNLLDLVAAEFELRARRERVPSIAEYVGRFPSLAKQIRPRLASVAAGVQKASPRHGEEVSSDVAGPLDTSVRSTVTILPRPRAQQAVLPAGATSGRFGEYELLEEIGRGGMGVVYQGRQLKLNRIVAVKMILAGQLASAHDVRRFYTEAEAAAKLDHPHIVPIYEVGEHEGQHYYSMGFVDGKRLSSRVADGPLPPVEAATLVAQIAEAVHYAHGKGIIHRDLKPSNVLLDGAGQPRVTDFGLAKVLESGVESLTATGDILGTPEYMSPEQAGGDVERVGPLSDVYALGAILYCLLCGRPPFQAARQMDTVAQVLATEPLSPRKLNPSVPRDLETITLKCLQKEPQRRYASAAQLADDLTRYNNGHPIRARRASAAYRIAKLARRNPLRTAVVLGLILLVVGSATGWSALMRHRRAQVAELQNKAVDALAARQDSLALGFLREARGLLAVWPPQRRLIEDIERQIGVLLAPAAAREKLQRFNQLFVQAQGKRFAADPQVESSEAAGELLAVCDEALELYSVFDSDPWEATVAVTSLSAEERAQLAEDMQTLLLIYCDFQRKRRMRGSALCGGFGFELYDSRTASATIPRVLEVVPGQPAAAAGVQIADRILQIDGFDTRTMADNEEVFQRLIGGPGTTVRLLVLRAGEDRTRVIDVRRSATGGLGMRAQQIGELTVLSVQRGSAAAAAGIAAGDQLLSIDGEPIVEVRVEGAKVHCTPLSSLYSRLQAASEPSLSVLVLGPRGTAPRVASFDWDRARRTAHRRAHVEFLAQEARTIRGAFESARFLKDSSLLEELHVADLKGSIEDYLANYFETEFWWPKDISREAAERSSDVYSQYRLGLELQGGLQYQEALAAFRRELQRHPAHADSYQLIGMCQYQLGQWQDAVTAWSANIALRPKDAFAHFWRGRAYRELEELELAKGDFSKALELDPELSGAREALDAVRARAPSGSPSKPD